MADNPCSVTAAVGKIEKIQIDTISQELQAIIESLTENEDWNKSSDLDSLQKSMKDLCRHIAWLGSMARGFKSRVESELEKQKQ